MSGFQDPSDVARRHRVDHVITSLPIFIATTQSQLLNHDVSLVVFSFLFSLGFIAWI